MRVDEEKTIPRHAAMDDAKLWESGFATGVVVVEVEKEGDHALPLLAKLRFVVRRIRIDEVEMGRDLLADFVVEHHGCFEVLDTITAGVRHAGLDEELYD